MTERSEKASYHDRPGNRTSSGRVFDANASDAAMLHVPPGIVVQLKDIATGRTIPVTDGGPHPPGRVTDLPKAAFAALAGGTGVGLVEVEVDVP